MTKFNDVYLTCGSYNDKDLDYRKHMKFCPKMDKQGEKLKDGLNREDFNTLFLKYFSCFISHSNHLLGLSKLVFKEGFAFV